MPARQVELSAKRRVRRHPFMNAWSRRFEVLFMIFVNSIAIPVNCYIPPLCSWFVLYLDLQNNDACLDMGGGGDFRAKIKASRSSSYSSVVERLTADQEVLGSTSSVPFAFCLQGSRWRIIACKHNPWRKKDTFGEQHTIAGSNCWLQSILEGPCRPSLSESESKDWGSQAILPPTNTHCKASVLSLGDTARSRICGFSHRTKHGSFTKESSPGNLAKGGWVCSRKWPPAVCGTPCKTVKDGFVKTSLGPASGRDRVLLQPWLCSLSSEKHVKML